MWNFARYPPGFNVGYISYTFIYFCIEWELWILSPLFHWSHVSVGRRLFKPTMKHAEPVSTLIWACEFCEPFNIHVCVFQLCAVVRSQTQLEWYYLLTGLKHMIKAKTVSGASTWRRTRGSCWTFKCTYPPSTCAGLMCLLGLLPFDMQETLLYRQCRPWPLWIGSS